MNVPSLVCRREFGEAVLLAQNLTGETPLQATRVRTRWNDAGWQVHFSMDDAQPWATLTERDGPLWTEEVVEIFVDPAGDLLSYFEIEINPLGTVTDLIVRRNRSGHRKDFAWRAEGLKASARMVPGGWEADLFLPFTTIGERGEWRVNFLRIDRPPGAPRELSAWSPTRTPTFHRPESFGRLTFE